VLRYDSRNANIQRLLLSQHSHGVNKLLEEELNSTLSVTSMHASVYLKPERHCGVSVTVKLHGCCWIMSTTQDILRYQFATAVNITNDSTHSIKRIGSTYLIWTNSYLWIQSHLKSITSNFLSHNVHNTSIIWPNEATVHLKSIKPFINQCWEIGGEL